MARKRASASKMAGECSLEQLSNRRQQADDQARDQNETSLLRRQERLRGEDRRHSSQTNGEGLQQFKKFGHVQLFFNF